MWDSSPSPLGSSSPCISSCTPAKLLSYQMTYKTKDRSLNVELSLALLASTFCSIGLFTLALSVGMYF